jgi:hypothetical protein
MFQRVPFRKGAYRVCVREAGRLSAVYRGCPLRGIRRNPIHILTQADLYAISIYGVNN